MKRDSMIGANLDVLLASRTFAAQSEREILGTLLLFGDKAFDRLPGGLGEHHFAVDQHRAIFNAIRSLASAGRSFTIVDVFEHIERSGHSEAREILVAMNEMSSVATGSLSALPKRADSLIETARMRQLRALSHEVDEIIARAATSGDVVSEIGHRLDEITGDQAVAGEKSLAGLIFAVMEYHSRMGELTAEERSRSTVRTGLSGLDEKLTLGLEPGDLIVIGARPSMGKTALATFVGLQAARAGHGALVMSMEMSGQQLAHRAVAAMLPRHLGEVRSLVWSEPLFKDTCQLVDQLAELPFWVDDAAACDIETLKLRVRRAKRRQPQLRVLVVDYLQLMSGTSNDETQARQMAEVSQGLKALSKELGITTIALSQLNRKVEDRPNKRPTMADLRESGAIEQDADVIILLYRDDYYDPDSMAKGVIEANFAKQRNGEVGVAYLSFDRSTQQFGDTLWRPGAGSVEAGRRW